MFQRIGNFAANYRKTIIAVWVLAAVILTLVAPPLDEVSTTDQKDLMPSNAQFVHAQEVFEQTFPKFFGPSSTILLVDAEDGGSVRDPEVWTFMQQAEAWLNGDEAPDNIASVSSPTSDPEFADAMISPDQQIALISVTLTTPTDAIATTKAVDAIDEWLEEQHHEGFTVYQTGDAGLNAQSEESTFTTMDRTIIITFVLVIVALLLIYRSPVSPLIPLFSVTMAFLVTIGSLSLLAKWDVINVIAQVNAILVVVMYGAGTDYCLFLISRFREEMADDSNIERSTSRTVRLVGESISASAGTIFVGFISLLFAEMGMFKSAGPMLAMGIAMSLLAGLTLTPALLATLGNRAFWPFKASHRSPGRFYGMTSQLVSSRPLLTIIVIVAVMLPFSISGLSRDLNFDFVSELPEEIPSVKGYHLLGEHMGTGNLFPMTVVVTDRDPETMPAEMAQLTAELNSMDAVVDVRGLDSPLGSANPMMNNLLRVDGQLAFLLMDEGEEDEATNPQEAAAQIAAMQDYVARLAERFPEAADDPNLLTLQEILNGGLLQIALREAEMTEAVTGLIARFQTIEDAYLMPPTGEGEMFAALHPLVESYIANEGTAYRLEVILDDPLGEGTKETVSTIRDLLEGYTNGGEAVVSGYSAVITDMVDTLGRDAVRIYIIVLSGIYVMLSIMLRSFVAPAYLIGTVLLSYTCTLGLTGLFFEAVYDVDTFSFLLPTFMFIFLVALGIDYSIFLFGRIKEEVGYHGTREGVHVAVAATGAIITSAAVILAGTFAGMMAGELLMLAQLGFAVSIGVLIDAFIVRTILDPALATLFGRWTWWPGGVPKSATPQIPVPSVAHGTGD